MLYEVYCQQIKLEGCKFFFFFLVLWFFLYFAYFGIQLPKKSYEAISTNFYGFLVTNVFFNTLSLQHYYARPT